MGGNMARWLYRSVAQDFARSGALATATDQHSHGVIVRKHDGMDECLVVDELLGLCPIPTLTPSTTNHVCERSTPQHQRLHDDEGARQ